MSPAKPVYFTTPDGVKRELRFTFGARKRIVDRFGMGLMETLNKYDVSALPELLYCCMFDVDGNPPKDFNLAAFVESDALEDAPALMATLMEAASRGRVEKNALEAQIRKRMETELQKLTGTPSGPSPISASIEEAQTSGNSPSENLNLSVSDIEKSKNETISASA